MTGLGQTNDPRALITGDPGAVYETEAQLRQYAEVLLEAGVGLRRIDTSDGWRGTAADAFRRIYDDQPGKWLRAGDAFQSAADALGGYAATLGWAQDAAATAIGLCGTRAISKPPPTRWPVRRASSPPLVTLRPQRSGGPAIRRPRAPASGTT